MERVGEGNPMALLGVVLWWGRNASASFMGDVFQCLSWTRQEEVAFLTVYNLLFLCLEWVDEQHQPQRRTLPCGGHCCDTTVSWHSWSFLQDSEYCQHIVTVRSYEAQYESVLLLLFWFSAFCFRTWTVCSHRQGISTASLFSSSHFSVALWRLSVKLCSCWNTEELCYWPQLGLYFTLRCCQVFDIYMPSSLLVSDDCN